MINRNHMALFHAVAEEGGFGRAARRLRISQPAVSFQVGQLEDFLGVRLFERTGRRIRLTPAGEELAVYARRIALLEAEAAKAMAEYAGLKHGRLRVGASTTIAAYLLPQLITEFRQRWPDIEPQLFVGNSAQVQQQVFDGLIDLGLVEGADPSSEIQMQVFRQDQLVAISSPDHPIITAKRPTLKAFLKSPLIMREADSGTARAVTDFLRKKGHSAEAAYTLGSTEAVKGAVAAGLGVSFVSSLTIAGDVMLRRLSVVPLTDAAVIRRPFFTLRLRGKTSVPPVEAFLSIIKIR